MGGAVSPPGATDSTLVLRDGSTVAVRPIQAQDEAALAGFYVGQHVEAFIVQRMAPPGVEMLVGVVQDRHFGPVVAVGAAGRAVELFRDAQIRLTPLGRTDAATMIRSLTTYPLLDGYRGATPVSVPALEEVLIRVGALVEAHSEVADVDFNPVIVHPSGAVIVDARIRVERLPDATGAR